MRGASAVVVLGLLALPGCSRGEGRVAHAAELGPQATRLVSCHPAHPYPASALHGPADAEGAETDAAAALRAELAPKPGVDSGPSSGWRLLLDDGETVVFGHGDPTADEDGDRWLTEMAFEREGTGFRLGPFSGGCTPHVQVPRHSLISFSTAAPSPLVPESRTFAIRVSERACTSGEPIGDRLRPPSVRYGRDTVEVLITAAPLDGEYFTCPGIPAQPATLELDEPLGGRRLLDASTYPPRDATAALY